MDLGSPPVLAFTNTSFTASAWVYLTGASDGSNDEGIVSRYPASGGAWILGRHRNGQLWFGVDSDGAWPTERSVFSATAAPLNQWHHVAAAYDHTSGALRIHVDGAADGTSSGAPLSIHPAVGGRVSIGAWWTFDGTDGCRALKGLVDEVALYARALSPDEIACKKGQVCRCKDRRGGGGWGSRETWLGHWESRCWGVVSCHRPGEQPPGDLPRGRGAARRAGPMHGRR
ncbi:MAG: LamG domain-containing protein [Verrucomicrobia bacterium]|nr:LamG domain-containing protein [Verrucomicrobiota bacterium]